MARPNNKQAIAPKEKRCYFCIHSLKQIDYKDILTLKRYVSSYGKIAPTRRSGVCSWHQRKLAQAIKRARHMALMPFTTR